MSTPAQPPNALPVAARRTAPGLAALLVLLAALWWLLVGVLPVPAPVATAVMIWGRYPLLLACLWQVWRLLRGPQALRDPRLRRGWLLLGLAIACVAIGDLIWGGLTLAGHADPTLSIATLFFLAYFPLLLAGLLAWPRVFRSRGDALTFTLDAATVGLGVGMLLWYIAVRPALGAASGGPWQRSAVALAFPIGDMLSVLGIALVLLRQPLGPLRRVTAALAMAMLCSLAGDLLWIFDDVLGSTGTQRGSYFLWLLQAMSFLLAARWQAQSMFPQADRIAEPDWHDRFQLLPHLASVLGFGLLAVVARGGEPLVVDATLLAAGVLLLLVTGRQWLGLRENTRLLAENLRQRGESRFAALVEHASDPILILNAEGVIGYASPATWQLAGGAGLVPGARLHGAVHPQDQAALHDGLDACRSGRVPQLRLVLRFGSGGGPWTITETTFSNLLGDAKVAGIVLNVRDVSERHALEEQLRFEALHDPLTGLPNRELFRDRIAQALLRQRRDGDGTLVVAALALDRLRLLADAFGHERGEDLLLASCGRLQAALTGGESLARLGTEELGLLLELPTAPPSLPGERLEVLRKLLAQPLTLDGQEVQSTASIGYAVLSAGGELDAGALLRNADIALQQARSEGGDRSLAFAGGQHAQLLDRLSLEARLPQLLATEAFVLKFQPVLALGGGARPCGLRISLDWRDGRSPQQSISDVLAAARVRGLDPLIGDWLLDALKRDLGALLRCVPQSTGSLWLQLPLSLLPLKSADLPERLSTVLRRIDWPLASLRLEVEADEAHARLASHPAVLALRAGGVQIALGGFGAGAQNLAQLGLWQPRLLELADTLGASLHAPAVRAALALAQALRFELSAAGVDDEDTATHLAALGVHQGRGAALGVAVPYERMLTWLGARLGD